MLPFRSTNRELRDVACALRQTRRLAKNGVEALLRNDDAADGHVVYKNFNLAYVETDYLLAYHD